MRRATWGAGLSVFAFACALGVAGERTASACGGCFHPPTQDVSDITDERMLLAVSQVQSTLYDQIRYSGNPSSFAWVLPIHGTVDVGLSADVLFDSIDAMTETTIESPAPNCPAGPTNCASPNAAGAAFAEDAAVAAPSVTVTKAENVGPYATVQLHSTDSSALESWLSDNGFVIPDDVKPIIAEYVTEGFDFLAMKLLPNQGVQAMRPVRVTTSGASLSLPLRMAAIGTGANVGITIWVVSDGRYEPQNFPFFHIEDKDLVWDFSTQSSNYTTLRAQDEAALNGKGWEIESSISLNEQSITDVITSGGVYYGNGGFGGAPVSNASDDYLPVDDADGGVTQSADDVRTADINALFVGLAGPNVRVTRMRSDIAHAAMTQDFVLQASSDQSELSNVRVVTQSVNVTCPVYQGCTIVGYAPLGPETPVSRSTSTDSTSTGANASAAPSGSDGCAASSQTTNWNDLMLGGLTGGLGIVILRTRRRRVASKR